MVCCGRFWRCWGASWVVSSFDSALLVLKWVAVAMFLGMGLLILRHAGQAITAESRLTRPGALAGFLAGLAAILGNLKAILFYMGVLPGFFDLSAVTTADIAVIVALSAIVPFIGNMGLAVFIDRLRRIMTSPAALRRINLTSGGLLIALRF